MTISITPRSMPVVPHSTDPVAELLERERVVSVITELCAATDRKDWSAVERCFDVRVHFDMSSVGGGAPAERSPADIAASWREGLGSIDHVHHQLGNFRVKIVGTRAEATCYGTAWHHKARRDGRNTRVFVGDYDFELEKEAGAWRITAMRFNCKFIDGNPALEAPE